MTLTSVVEALTLILLHDLNVSFTCMYHLYIINISGLNLGNIRLNDFDKHCRGLDLELTS